MFGRQVREDRNREPERRHPRRAQRLGRDLDHGVGDPGIRHRRKQRIERQGRRSRHRLRLSRMESVERRFVAAPAAVSRRSDQPAGNPGVREDRPEHRRDAGFSVRSRNPDQRQTASGITVKTADGERFGASGVGDGDQRDPRFPSGVLTRNDGGDAPRVFQRREKNVGIVTPAFVTEKQSSRFDISSVVSDSFNVDADGDLFSVVFSR